MLFRGAVGVYFLEQLCYNITIASGFPPDLTAKSIKNRTKINQNRAKIGTERNKKRKMSDINKGVLIFNEWFEAMKVLSMEERAQLIYAMYDFQINNIPPPKFSSVADSLATIFFKCIENRKVQSRRGLMSAAA